MWAKREDCNSGIAYGGNKTRKLEYLVPDALGTGCDTLVSIGGVQSNHTRQVAGVAARVGLADAALESVRAAGGTPYAIPAGASDHPLGGLGFARWAYEVVEQEAARGVLRHVVVCSVTGSTQAGMVAGFAAIEAAGGRPRRVLDIDASAKPAETGTRSLGSPGPPRPRSGSAATWRWSWTSATTPARTESRTNPRWTPCGWRPGPRA